MLKWLIIIKDRSYSVQKGGDVVFAQYKHKYRRSCWMWDKFWAGLKRISHERSSILDFFFACLQTGKGGVSPCCPTNVFSLEGGLNHSLLADQISEWVISISSVTKTSSTSCLENDRKWLPLPLVSTYVLKVTDLYNKTQSWQSARWLLNKGYERRIF